jgi:hypothetical protein
MKRGRYSNFPPKRGLTMKHMKRLGIAAFATLFSAALVGPASATLVVLAAVGGAPTGVSFVNFDDLALGSAGGVSSVSPSGTVTVSFTPDGQVVKGSIDGIAAPPFISNSNGVPFGYPTVSGPDPTNYLSAGKGTFTVIFPAEEKYLGLLWGSVDDFNKLEFFDGAASVGFLTGTNILASPSGDQGVNGTLYVNINSDLQFDRVVGSETSSEYAFEADNFAFNPRPIIETPEPGTLALFGVGLVGLWFVRRRRTA